MHLTIVSWALVAAGLLQQPSAAPGALSYEVFRDQVQPIFLAKRPGHARCVVCHSAGTPFRLQPLEPGKAAWTEDESRKNFEAVRKVAIRGNLKSLILTHPLAEAAGGDDFHNGGKHWQSQDAPEWQTLKAWILGQTPPRAGSGH
jgi:hypothetical protein